MAAWLLLSVTQPAHAAAPANQWWSNNYGYRSQVSIYSSVAASSGYSVSISFNHAALVTAGKALASGNDLRVTYWNGSSWTELDRVLDDRSASSWNSSTTTIYFKTQSAISAGSTNDNYYIYYGYSTAGSPPATALNVFLLYDNFSSNSLNTSMWDKRQGSVSFASGIMTLNTSSTVMSNSNYKFDVKSRFEAYARYTNSYAPNSNNNTNVFYLWGANKCDNFSASCHWLTFWANSSNHLIDMRRDNSSNSDYASYTYTLSNPTSYHYYTFDRISTTRAVFYVDNTQVLDANNNGAVPTDNDLKVLMIDQNTTYSQQYDWVRVRNYVSPEPQATVAAEVSSSGTVNHFGISHSGSGVTCQAEPVVITAHDSSHGTYSSYTGTISLTTSTAHGDWSVQTGNGTLTNSGNGSATYAFVAGDNGQVTLKLKDTYAETTNINVAAGAVTENASEDANLVFSQTGFLFLANGSNNAIGTQIAGKASNVAPNAQTLRLWAVKTSTQTGACTTALSGSVAVDLAFECVNPTTCAGQQVSINGTNIAANASGSISSYTSKSLTFGSTLAGAADLTVSYPDAGSIKLYARYNIPLGSGANSGNLMSGSSNAFVVGPFGFDIDFSSDRASNGTTGTSYAASASGGRFNKAGATFATTTRAVVWSAADDANADGLPDGATLTDNAATPNFGRETSPATVSFAASLVAPVGGTLGTLAGGSSVSGFSSGVATPSLSYSEVGIINLTASLANYLSSGAAVSGTVYNVGRFYPASFSVSTNTPTFRNGPDSSWTCGFTYLDQLFGYGVAPVITLTAKNSSGATTLNYGGSFWKLSSSPYLSHRSYTNTATTTATLDAPASGTVTLASTSDYDGIGTLSLANEVFSYQRGASLVAPFSAAATLTLTAADLTDSDGVCYQGAGATCVNYAVTGINGAALRHGRIDVQNGYGSELIAVSLPARTQYYNGTAFVTNSNDNCTALTTSSIDLSSATTNPARGVTTIAVGSGSTSVSYVHSTASSGELGLSFAAPGAGNTGDVNMLLDLSVTGAPSWLQYDWDGNGSKDSPQGRASFGLYPGNKAIIYVREPW